MLDWNVFYSSLAQSTAAFLGLLGAFIITKIVNNEQQYNESKVTIEEYLIIANNLRERLKNRSFDWYNERTKESVLDKFEEDSYKNKTILYEAPEEIYDKYSFSRFDNKQEILKCIETKQKKILRGNNEI